jgi:condensin complex protein MksE
MYPDKHKEIVTSLMDGKFITVEDLLFETIKKNEDFYIEFFENSFGFELIGNHDFYYLVSIETNENTSRDISIFFSILCYELDKDGKNFLEELNYSEFHIDEIIEYFNNSSWTDVIKANKQLNNEESLKRHIGTMVKRNIAVKENNERYSFTKAHKLFIDFAKDLIEGEKNESIE